MKQKWPDFRMSSVSTVQFSATLVPDNRSCGGSGPTTRSYGVLPRLWSATIVLTFLSCPLDWIPRDSAKSGFLP